MTSMLGRRPEAATYAIEDLVPLALQGTLRIPPFQRVFKWRSTDIRDFFDSIYRGFPVGTLLFWKKPAKASKFFLGPVEIEAKAQDDALWIVDGQQRLSSLVGVLGIPEGVADDFELYFDLGWEDKPREERKSTDSPFHFREGRRPAAPSWLPMSVVVDSERLDEWLDDSGMRGNHPEYVRRARRLNKLIREYRIPAYVVESDDAETLGLIFDRTNTAGRRLDKSEVFNALLTSAGEGFRLEDLGKQAVESGFGTLDEDLLFKVVLAANGIDFTAASTRILPEKLRSDSQAFAASEAALRKAVEFLRKDAGIPHVALLPYGFPVVVLSRFFRLYPHPAPRSRALLVRWVWRGAISGEHRTERIPAVRAVLKGLDGDAQGDEEAAVQTLLASVPAAKPEKNDKPFRFGTAQAKLDLLALASLGPKNLVEGNFIDVGALVAEYGSKAVQWLPQSEDDSSTNIERNMAHFVVHPPIGRRAFVSALISSSPDVLQGHGFDSQAAEALQKGDYRTMIAMREQFLQRYADAFLEKHARWGESDRPSLRNIAGEPEEDDNDA